MGSVSFRPQLILDGGAAVHRMWVTLFEHEDDDEYDGMMGLHDEEEPCVLMEFEVAQELAPNFKSSSELSLKATSQRLYSPTPLQQIDNRGPIAYHSVETKKMPVLSQIKSETPKNHNFVSPPKPNSFVSRSTSEECTRFALETKDAKFRLQTSIILQLETKVAALAAYVEA